MFAAVDVAADDVLLDYGAGKGRVALWAASRLPLRRVVALERDADLSAAARVNHRRWPYDFGATDVEFIVADASGYAVPDDVTLVYLFNPFVGELFERVLRNLVVSVEAAPRRLRVVYHYPLMHDALIKSGFVLEQMHRHVTDAWATYVYVATA